MRQSTILAGEKVNVFASMALETTSAQPLGDQIFKTYDKRNSRGRVYKRTLDTLNPEYLGKVRTSKNSCISSKNQTQFKCFIEINKMVRSPP